MDSSATAVMNEFYERFTQGATPTPWDKIGFFNIGYWKGVENSPEIAQLNLIETLVGFFTRLDGSVLDVACGKGASTKFLTKYFDPKRITGINISPAQLEICRLIAPECDFRLMSATELELPDSSFDNVLCIEAAQHFRTRYTFFQEAHRVLTPGGRLAIHDIVFHDPAEVPDPQIWPKENYMPNLDTYRQQLLQAGFTHVRVEDITQFSANAAMAYLARKIEKELDHKRNHKELQEVMRALNGHAAMMPNSCSWCMAYAIK